MTREESKFISIVSLLEWRPIKRGGGNTILHDDMTVRSSKHWTTHNMTTKHTVNTRKEQIPLLKVSLQFLESPVDNV